MPVLAGHIAERQDMRAVWIEKDKFKDENARKNWNGALCAGTVRNKSLK